MQRSGGNLLSHAAIYLVARGLPGIIAFLAIPLFTALLQPDAYGRYMLVLGAASLVNALAFQWVRLSLVRYLPAYRHDPARLKSTLLTATLLLIALLGLACGLVALLPWARDWRWLLLPCWVALTTQALFELCCEYARAQVRPWQVMWLQLGRCAVGVGLGVMLVLAWRSWWGPLFGTAGGMLLATVVAYRNDWRSVRLWIDRQTLARVCQYGIPLSLTVALTIVISTSDRFLIAHYLQPNGEYAAGLYSAAVDLTSQTITLLLMSIYMAVFPIAVRAWEHDGPEAARQQMRANAAMLLAVGIPCVIGMMLIAPSVATILGKSYRAAAAGIMPMIALGTFLAGFKACHFDTAFQFAHRTIHQVWIVLIAAAANVALNVVLVPRHGINGAATASVLAYVLSIAITAVVGRRHFALPFPVRASVQVLIAAAVMSLVLWPLRRYVSRAALVVQVSLAGAAYAMALVALNFMHVRDAIVRRLRGPLPLATETPGEATTTAVAVPCGSSGSATGSVL